MTDYQGPWVLELFNNKNVELRNDQKLAIDELLDRGIERLQLPDGSSVHRSAVKLIEQRPAWERRNGINFGQSSATKQLEAPADPPVSKAGLERFRAMRKQIFNKSTAPAILLDGKSVKVQELYTLAKSKGMVPGPGSARDQAVEFLRAAGHEVDLNIGLDYSVKAE